MPRSPSTPPPRPSSRCKVAIARRHDRGDDPRRRPADVFASPSTAKPIIEDARLGLKLREGTTLGADVELASSSSRSEDSTWENPLGKRRVVRNQYRELTLLLRERSAKDRTFQLIFRVFDDGVAFRYVLLSQPGMREFVLDEELTEFRFPGRRDLLRRRAREQGIRLVAGMGVPPSATLRDHARLGEGFARAGGNAGRLGRDRRGRPARLVRHVDRRQAARETSETTAADRSPIASRRTAVTLVAKLAPRLDGEGLVKADDAALVPRGAC